MLKERQRTVRFARVYIDVFIMGKAD